MELKEVVPMVVMTVANIVQRAKTAKYYPVLFQISDTVQGKRATYYLEDLRAWADGDIGGIAGMELEVIMGLAQAVTSYTERMEAASPPPEGMRRIESREDDEDQF